MTDIKKCASDGTPCLHVPCLESQGIACCAECEFIGHCASACFKAKEGKDE